MTQTAHAVTLCGSVETVTEYLGFAVNNILYQRGIYPAESFQQVRKYGLPLMVSCDDALNEYLANLLQQIALWTARRECRLVALLLVNPASDEVVERWEFTIVEEAEEEEGDGAATTRRRKSEEELRREVQAVLRQITACVSFLPVLDDRGYAFDVVVYTTMDVGDVPSAEWEASSSRQVHGGVSMQLKAFRTGFHKVSTTVSYRE